MTVLKQDKPDIFGDMMVATIDALSKLEKENPMRIVDYPKSDVEIEQEKEGFKPARWWQARDKDGSLLAETSSRSDFKNLDLLGEEAQKDGVNFHRLYEKVERKWVEEHPFPEKQEWREIAGFPKYEMTLNGFIRTVETHERPQPLFMGDEGVIGYQLHRGLGVHLKSLQTILDETFPEQAEDPEVEHG